MDVNSIRFRCSSLGKIMTRPRSGPKDGLSETCKDYLLEVYINVRYGRHRLIASKYIDKGLGAEEDNFTLYSRVKKRLYFKNEAHLHDKWIMGTPDHLSETEVLDLKSSWDIFTFFAVQGEEINKDYYWQMQGYMPLTGRKIARLAYGLVDTPTPLIEDEKRKLSWKMGLASTESQDPAYLTACEQIDRLSVYDDIPLEERVYEIIIPYDQDAVDQLRAKVEQCRVYMAATWPDFFLVPQATEN